MSATRTRPCAGAPPCPEAVSPGSHATSVGDAVAAIRAGPEGPRIGAFFDFDGTLIDGYSAATYFFDRLRRGELNARELADVARVALQGEPDEARFAEIVGRGIADWAGRAEAEMVELWQRLFTQKIAGTLFPEAWDLVKAHHRMGNTVAVASSALPYQVAPAAEELGIAHLLCTQPMMRRGRLTGGIVGEPLWGTGKAAAVRAFARANRITLARSHAYANGNEDIAFLETVDRPTAVNPKPVLAQTAQRLGWPVLRFAPRRKPTVATLARSLGAYGALAVTALGGLAYAKATGRTRQAAELVGAISADAMLAITGVDVQVQGERHLWTHRPAVFVINHQSKAEGYVLLSLLRRGVTGVAKKEAADIPLAGAILRALDVAFIDRAHTRSAIEAMQPAVERLRAGTSVVISPEGTRSRSARLAAVPARYGAGVRAAADRRGGVEGRGPRPSRRRSARALPAHAGRLAGAGWPRRRSLAMTRPIRVAVLGAGSWGTTVASLAAANASTLIWARRAEMADEINHDHRNGAYLGDLPLHPALRATASLDEAVGQCDALVVGVPSHSVRATLAAASRHIRPWVPVVSLAKGLEQSTHLRMTEVIAQALPGHPAGILAGPNIAREIAQGMAAAAVIAMPDPQVARALQPLLGSRMFRVYTNTDVVGCELGGPLKNVIAIAAGMADGLGVGVNTLATVVTRGLAELTRFGVAFGGRPETFAGLTGLGDLMTTCMSPLSRNRQVGVKLARGLSTAEIVASMHMVAEGIKTSAVVTAMAAERNLKMPIAEEVAAVIRGERSAEKAFRGLMRVAPGAESDAAA